MHSSCLMFDVFSCRLDKAVGPGSATSWAQRGPLTTEILFHQWISLARVYSKMTMPEFTVLKL